jgi:endonuclease YncB( thermonuclease family)
MRLLLLAALAAFSLAAGAQPPRSYQATVTHVADGDTVYVRPPGGGRPVAIRIQGVDAPERCQAHGARARQALQRLVWRQLVRIDELGRDDHRRTLARVQFRGQDVGGWLVANGHAWSYRFRRDPGPYADEEAAARQARRGLWAAAQPVEPRQFRRRHGHCPAPAQQR